MNHESRERTRKKREQMVDDRGPDQVADNPAGAGGLCDGIARQARLIRHIVTANFRPG